MTTLPGRAEMMELIRPVQDPEMHVSIVDLGLVYDVELHPEEKKARIKMTLTSPGCPLAGQITNEVKTVAEKAGYVDAAVELVWEPKWNPQTMASDEAKDRMGIW